MTKILCRPSVFKLAMLLAAGITLLRPLEAGASSSPQLRSLRLLPENRTLWGAKSSQYFLVLGIYSDGLQRDVTAESRFSVSNSKVATVDSEGRVFAQANGKTTLTASFGPESVKTQVQVVGSEQTRPFSFASDIGGIFTKQGCNDSSCHGGVKGQGGFKLSLNALYPRDDYKWTVEGGRFQVLTAETGPKLPRIDLKEPEKSLLLTKPAMTVPYGGGQRFSPGSPDYETILKWVQSGAPYGEEAQKGGVRVVKVEVEPSEVVLPPSAKHRLLVTAHLSNGQQEDISTQVLYASGNPDVVSVDKQGEMAAVRTGETSVMVRAAGFAVSARVGVIAKPVTEYPEVPRRNFIDDHVFAKLKKFNILPSEVSSDTEFLRRVCLDLTGTLPPPERVSEFVASKDPQKRQKIAETLMKTPEFADYWTFRFSDFFRVAFFANGFNTRWAETYWEWIRDNVKNNRPYDQVARERLTAAGYSAPSRHFLNNAEVGHPENQMAEQIRVFWGRRLDCAQCHNHPFEAWSQDQFWGLTAFFGKMDLVGGRGEEFGTVIYESPNGEDVVIGRSGKVVNPRTKEEVKPTFLDGKGLLQQDRLDPRSALADWIVSQPYFAEATVNRFWGYFFGRGIVDPVDDFRSTNPATHPELLQALAKDFRDCGYDLKHLMRTIVSSRTYQLSSQTNETNIDDRINYSHALPRPLDAEVLLDAISYVTGVPDVFDQSREKPGALPIGTRAINVKVPDVFRSRILSIYGRPIRTSIPERNGNPNLAQALHTLSGYTFVDKIAKPGGKLDLLLRSGVPDAKVIEELYLLTLSRFPAAQERSMLERMVSEGSSRKQAFQDLLWGLLTSREFAENH